MYILHVKEKDAAAFDVVFLGFEDLGDVMAEIEELSTLPESPCPKPWGRGRYDALGVFAADGCDFAVMV